MPDRDWVPFGVIVVVLIASAIITWGFLGQPTCTDFADLSGENDQRQQEQPYAGPITCERDCQISFDFAGASENESNDAAEQSNGKCDSIAKQDLIAQNVMAHWAKISALLALIALCGLLWTLWENRRIGEAQNRAYLLVESGWITKADATDISAVVKIKNFGHTPAVDARSWISIWVEANPLKVVLPDAPHDLSMGQANIGAGTYHEFSHPRGMGLRTWEIVKIRAGEAAIYVFGEARYKDVFGRPHVTKFRLHCSGLQAFDQKRLAPYISGNEIN